MGLLDSGLRRNDGGGVSSGVVGVTWVPACAGMTGVGMGMTGVGMGMTGVGMGMTGVGAGGRLGVTWVPACAGMTKKRGGNDERGRE